MSPAKKSWTAVCCAALVWSFSWGARASDPLRENTAAAQGRVDATRAKLVLSRNQLRDREVAYEKVLKSLSEELKLAHAWTAGDSMLQDAATRSKLCEELSPAGGAAAGQNGAPPPTVQNITAEDCEKLLKEQQASSKYEGARKALQKVTKDPPKKLPADVKTLAEKLAKAHVDLMSEPALSFCGPTELAKGADGKVAECKGKIEAFTQTIQTAAEAAAVLKQATSDHEKLEAELAERIKERDAAVRAQTEAATTRFGLRFRDRMQGARLARCTTAYCWGGDDGTEFAVEPIIDLPISMFWALGDGSLARHINANRLDISVAAGIRFWFSYDQASLGLLLATPTLTGNNTIRVDHSDQTFPTDAISRPFPTLALGLAGDLITFTISYDQLRNTDGNNPVDDNYLPNQVLSRTFVLGVSLYPFTAARNALGGGGEKSSSGGGGT
jgi:hypothetical protein